MIRGMRTFRERWMHFWFEPVEPLNLGLCRVLFFGGIFLFYLPADFSGWGEISSSFWMPIWLFETLHLPPLSSDLLSILQSIWKVSLALSCLGLFTRVSTVSSFIFGLYLLGLPQNFGQTYHEDALVIFVLGIMALSRCGDAYSVDRLIRKARQGSRTNLSVQSPRVSGEYKWPVRAVWIMFALIFFAAGVSKLRNSGLEWILSDYMAILLIESHYSHGPLVTWALDLAQYNWLAYKWLTKLLAAGTIAIETSYPLALFSRRARWVLVPGGFFLQVGIRVVMGPAFEEFLICNVFWIPWDRVSRAFVRNFHKLSSLREPLRPYKKEPSK